MLSSLLFRESPKTIGTISQDAIENAAGVVVTIAIAFIGEREHLFGEREQTSQILVWAPWHIFACF